MKSTKESIEDCLDFFLQNLITGFITTNLETCIQKTCYLTLMPNEANKVFVAYVTYNISLTEKKKTLKTLANERITIINETDRGRPVVIMDREIYTKK